MSKEIISQATRVIDEEVGYQFCVATDRMVDFNDRVFDDNPQAILEELNSLLPWLYKKPGFHFELVDGFIIGVQDE